MERDEIEKLREACRRMLGWIGYLLHWQGAFRREPELEEEFERVRKLLEEAENDTASQGS